MSKHQRYVLVLAFVFGGNIFAAELAAESPSKHLGLPPTPTAGHSSSSLIKLGEKIFHDPRLSIDGTISCSSCHQQSKAFSDGRTVAIGVLGQAGSRNTPSLFNAGFNENLFWDGRREVLESMVLDPLLNPLEHGLSSPSAIRLIVTQAADYKKNVQDTFKIPLENLTVDQIAEALAAFVRSLTAADTPADKFVFGHKRDAVTPAAQAGLALFRGKAGCSSCHTIGETAALYTDQKFHAINHLTIPAHLGDLVDKVIKTTPQEMDALIAQDPEVAALGRFVVTRNPKDIGKFKTPSLRNVALTAPYLHDGSIKSLTEMVDREIYYRSLRSGAPVIITISERENIVEFLRALTSSPLIEPVQH